MRRLEIKRQLSVDDIAAVTELLHVAERADHHRALDDHRWLDMAQGGRESFAGLVAWEPGHGHPVSYAQVSRSPVADAASWALDLVIDPHHRGDAASIGQEMLRAALDIIRHEGGGHVHLWLQSPDASSDSMAEAVGLSVGRDLLQLRRSLPVPGPAPDIELRSFRPGEDEEAWLVVNNRAFNWHPEQGGWDRDTIEAREAEPWFDPDGFLLHEREGRLAGFCWTKVHDDVEPHLGEIYVIAVDPDFAGLGLGQALTLAGLNALAERGLGVGMLYVDADNAGARHLYDGLGFRIDHVDRAYVGDLPGRA